MADEEALPFRDGSLDLVVSALALQFVNDLPGALIQIRRALKPDGLFLAAMLGGDTLTELRQAFAAAEAEIEGGVSPRVAPFADVREMGALLQRAGFALPVTDVERLTVRYSSPFILMGELRRMGATNVLTERRRTPLRRATLKRMAEIYAQRFADPDGKVRATFEIIWLSGWAPHESQQKPLRPGSAQTRLADALGTREIGTGEKPKGRGDERHGFGANPRLPRQRLSDRGTLAPRADALGARRRRARADAPWYAHAARIFLRVIWPWTGIRIEPGGAARFPYARYRRAAPLVRSDTRSIPAAIAAMSAAPAATRHALVDALRGRRRIRGSRRDLHAVRARARRARCGRQPELRVPRRHAAARLLGRAALPARDGDRGDLGDRAGRRLGAERGHLGQALRRPRADPARVRYARKNRPRRFEPGAIPADVLPDAE